MSHPLANVFEFIAYAKALWLPIWHYLNSNFSAALFGAFAGAYGAHLLAKWHRQRSELLSEVRATNSAIMLAHDISNAYLGFKKQFIADFKAEFEEGKAAFLEAENRHNANRHEPRYGGIWKPTFVNGASTNNSSEPILEIKFNLQSLTPFSTPIALLQEFVFEKISLNGRPLNLAPALFRTTETLNVTIIERAIIGLTYQA